MDSQLQIILDKLWHNPQKRNALSRGFVSELDDNGLLILSGWDTAASTGPANGKLLLNFPNYMKITDANDMFFLQAKLTHSYEDTKLVEIIKYRDLEYSVIVDKSSPYVPQMHLDHSFSHLLVALQLIRDHIDSVLLWPNEMRRKKFSNFAKTSGLEFNHFLNLSKWFSAISSFVIRI